MLLPKPREGGARTAWGLISLPRGRGSELSRVLLGENDGFAYHESVWHRDGRSEGGIGGK